SLSTSSSSSKQDGNESTRMKLRRVNYEDVAVEGDVDVGILGGTGTTTGWRTASASSHQLQHPPPPPISTFRDVVQ
ncbi:unnamed protein product, partial [Amoebophrya sp. A120]